jgi:hypothetical protein
MGQDQDMGQYDGVELAELIAGATLLAKEGTCADSSCPGMWLLPDGRLLVVGQQLTASQVAVVPGLSPLETAVILDGSVLAAAALAAERSGG